MGVLTAFLSTIRIPAVHCLLITYNNLNKRFKAMLVHIKYSICAKWHTILYSLSVIYAISACVDCGICVCPSSAYTHVCAEMYTIECVCSGQMMKLCHHFITER